MKLLDRTLLRGYFKAYFVCFFSLVSLYIVIDLFSNLDEFAERSKGPKQVLQAMGTYYGYRIVMIFDRLCGVIVLLAAMFTVAWMQRNNELLPLLSAGIPTRRVLRPIFLGTLIMLGLSMANREFLMPRIARHLQNTPEDPRGDKEKLVNGGYEPNGILIAGQYSLRREQAIHNFTCTIPERIAGGLLNLTAREARYIPKGVGPHTGGWLMNGTTPAELPRELAWKQPVLLRIDTGKFFLKVERCDFAYVTRNRTWFQFAATWDIYEEVRKANSPRLSAMTMHLHLRATLPILTLIMALMGLSLLLRDQNRNIYVSAGVCVILSALFHGTCYACRYLGEYGHVSPPLAAWAPVLLFGPLAFAMYDAIHT